MENNFDVMNNVKGLLIFVLFSLLSCLAKQHTKQQLISMLRSEDKDSIVDAVKVIQASNDTSMLFYLLGNADDPRLVHRIDYKGMSIYQIKMNTVKFLTGVVPETGITYRPDSSIIRFYLSRFKG